MTWQITAAFDFSKTLPGRWSTLPSQCGVKAGGLLFVDCVHTHILSFGVCGLQYNAYGAITVGRIIAWTIEMSRNCKENNLETIGRNIEPD